LLEVLKNLSILISKDFRYFLFTLLSLFTKAFGIILFIFFGFNYTLKSSVIIESNSEKYTFIGNSLVANNIYDKEANSIRNFGLEGELYYWSKFKVQHLLSNRTISGDTVFLEVTSNQFQSNVNPLTQNKINGFLPRYMPFMSWKDVLKIFRDSRTLFFYRGLKRSLFWNINTIRHHGFKWKSVFGGYKEKEGSHIVDKNLFSSSPAGQLDWNNVNLKAFLETITLLESKGYIVCYFFSPKPLSNQEYWNNSNVATIELLKSIGKNDNLIRHNYEYLPDSMFADKWHLNKTGAKYFTQKFMEFLRE